MEIADSAAIAWEPYVHPREGRFEQKILHEGDFGDGRAFMLTLARFGKGDEAWKTPRHRHTFEQIRIPLDQPLNYGKGRDIPTGWIAFYPEGAHYGPELIDGGRILLLQFGKGYLTTDQKKRSQDELAERGRFHDGVYTWTDETSGKTRNMDGIAAVWQHANGQEMKYRAPCYPDQILIDPNAFDWQVEGAARPSTKDLGRFGRDRVGISILQFTEGTSHQMNTDACYLGFVLRGSIDVNGDTCPSSGTFFVKTGEDCQLGGVGDLVLMEFPGV